jgi:hypothetical protein
VDLIFLLILLRIGDFWPDLRNGNLVKAFLDPFLASMGSYFFLYTLGVLFLGVYLRSGNATLTAVLFLVLGGVILSVLPVEMQGPIYIFLALIMTVVIYRVFAK